MIFEKGLMVVLGFFLSTRKIDKWVFRVKQNIRKHNFAIVEVKKGNHQIINNLYYHPTRKWAKFDNRA